MLPLYSRSPSQSIPSSNSETLRTDYRRRRSRPCPLRTHAMCTNTVKILNQILVVILKIGKEVKEFWQSVGVRQGDNMAHVLFLFLMSAFVETLKIEWKNTDISICTVQSVIGTELANRGGKLCEHIPKNYLSRSLTVVDILQCLYVDDGAFIFMTVLSAFVAWDG